MTKLNWNRPIHKSRRRVKDTDPDDPRVVAEWKAKLIKEAEERRKRNGKDERCTD